MLRGALEQRCFLTGSNCAAPVQSRAPQVALVIKNPFASAGDVRDTGSIPRLRRSSGGGHGNPLQVFLPGESHGQRSLADYSPWGRKASDTTEATRHEQAHRVQRGGGGTEPAVRREVGTAGSASPHLRSGCPSVLPSLAFSRVTRWLGAISA